MIDLEMHRQERVARVRTARRASPLGSRWTPYLFLAPAALVLLALQVAPVLQEIRLSFTQTSLLSPNTNIWVGLKNYTALFADPMFFQVLTTTLTYLVVCIVGPVGIGLLTALLLNGRFRGRGLARALVTVPWAAPGVAVALILTWMLNAQYGIVNRILDAIGLGVPGGNIINSPTLAFPAILIITIWQLFPFCCVVLVSALQSVSQDVVEAAEMDGAGPVWTFRAATWPVIKPTVTLLAVLSAIWSLRIFEIIWIMTQGGPNGATSTLVINLYSQAFTFHQLGSAAAIGVVGVVISLVLVTASLLITRRARSEDQ